MSTQSNIKKKKSCSVCSTHRWDAPLSCFIWWRHVTYFTVFTHQTERVLSQEVIFLTLFLLLHHFLEKSERRGHIWCESSRAGGEISRFNSCNTLLDFSVCGVSAMTLNTRRNKLVSHEQRPPQTQGPELTASHCQLISHTQELSDPSACHQCSHCGLQLTGRFNTVTDADDGASDYSAVICYFTQLSCEWVRSEEGTYRPGSKIQKRGHTLEPKPELRLSSSPTQSHSAFLRHGSCDNCLDIKQLFTQNFFIFFFFIPPPQVSRS